MNFEAKKKRLNWRKIIPVVIVLMIAGYSVGQPYLVKWTGINFPSLNENQHANNGNHNHSDGPSFVPNSGEQNTSTSSSSSGFKLQEIGGDKFRSPAGLVYRRARSGEHRIDHVMRHAKDDPGRPVHGYFADSSRDGVLALVDEAYELAKSNSNRVDVDKDPKKSYRTVYTVDMQRKIGFKGGKSGKRDGNPALKKLKLVIDNGDQVITAYPK